MSTVREPFNTVQVPAVILANYASKAADDYYVYAMEKHNQRWEERYKQERAKVVTAFRLTWPFLYKRNVTEDKAKYVADLMVDLEVAQMWADHHAEEIRKVGEAAKDFPVGAMITMEIHRAKWIMAAWNKAKEQ